MASEPSKNSKEFETKDVESKKEENYVYKDAMTNAQVYAYAVGHLMNDLVI